MTKYDSLVFCAAGAFTSLPRPGQTDAARLDALAMPLFDQLSTEGKRRIAAVLSECRDIIPTQLIEALILQPLEISASLLISRAEIPDHLLEKTISICGEPHARVILLRTNISIAVKERIDNFIESIVPVTEIEVTPLDSKDSFVPAPSPKTKAQTELEIAQERLRNMMMRKALPEPALKTEIAPFAVGENITIVARLINLALAGDADFLVTALADEWSAPFQNISSLVQRNQLHNLSVLLKGLDFGATDTFAIVSAFNPAAFASREAIAAFYLKFQSITDHHIKAIGLEIQQKPAPADRSILRVA